MPANPANSHSAWPVGARIEYAETVDHLPGEAERLVSRLFSGYDRMLITRELGGGFTQSRVLVAEPRQSDGGSDLPLVLKIGPTWLIEQEQAGYTQFIRDKLAGRIELVAAKLTEDWGVLGYRLAGDGQFKHVSLADYCRQTAGDVLTQMLRNRLFKRLATLWRNTELLPEPYLAGKYELLLPVQVMVTPQKLPNGAARHLIRPDRLPGDQLALDDPVRIAGFVISEVDRQASQVTLDLPPEAGRHKRSYRLRLQPVEAIERYRVGQLLPEVEGRVTQTRRGRLRAEIDKSLRLSAEFALAGDQVRLANGRDLPNPLAYLPDLLVDWPPVRLAYQHGDLNLENVLVDPATRDVTLIDFANAGVEHGLHDLLHLEMSVITSLLAEALVEVGQPPALIGPVFYERLHRAAAVDPGLYAPPRLLQPALKNVYVILAAIRQTASAYLSTPNQWSEYYRGLALYLAGALKFRDLDETASAPYPKQLAFLGSAVAVDLWQRPDRPSAPAADLETFCAELRSALAGSTPRDLKQEQLDLPGGASLLNPLAALPLLLELWIGTKLGRVYGQLDLAALVTALESEPNKLIEAEVDRDERLHHLLRLETGVAAGLLPQALVNAGQPPESLLFLFFERLHRAAGGDPAQFDPPKAIHPALVRPYTLLAAIRRQAGRFLTGKADWADYYQGLAIYLLGALRRDGAEGWGGGHICFLAAAIAVDLWQKPQDRPCPPSPYRGLHAFQEEDAPFFFGRKAFVDQLVETVQQRPLLAVTGASGSGKSSATLAGLASRLRQSGRWLIITLRPGSAPFEELAKALAPLLALPPDEAEPENLAAALRDGRRSLADLSQAWLDRSRAASRLLLIIDQFEELYTLCPNPDSRRRFIDTLLAIATPANREPVIIQNPQFKIVITLRADFMGKALAYRPLADALQANVTLLGAMTRTELGRVIEMPAEKLGVSFEAGLVERILDDVGDEPGHLPLLEFALTQLWQLQTNGRLTWAAYEAIGRVSGAVTHYAEQVYDDLTPAQQAQARYVFTQLVHPGAGTEDTRRVATAAELSTVWPLVQQLSGSRLVITNRDAGGAEIVEVVHEALIHSWARLGRWMEADRTFRAWQERLRATRNQWQATRQDDGGLLRGATLAEAEEWLQQRPGDLSQGEQEFIRRSAALRAQQQAATEAERRRQLEQAQALAEAQRRRAEEQTLAAARLRQRAIWLGTTLVLLLLALVGAIILFRFWTSAEDRRLAAEQSVLTAEQRRATADYLADVAEQRQATAEISARLAETAEANAQAAAATAVAAQQAAEAGQQVAVVARQTAQVNLATARAQQALAESNEREAVIAQQAAIAGEATAQGAEHLALAARQTAQAGQATAEANRATAQTRRDEAETARQQASKALVAAEAAKQAAEAARQAAERAAEQAEQELQGAEAAASQAQATQAAAEALRDEAEADLAQTLQLAAIIGNTQNCTVDSGNPQPGALAYDGEYMWVTKKTAKNGQAEITKVRAGDCQILGHYPIGSGSAVDVALGGGFVWVVTLNNELRQIEPATGQTRGVYKAGPSGNQPSAVLYDFGAVWVTSSNFDDSQGSLREIEPQTGAALGTYRTGSRPADLMYHAGDIWVANANDDSVSRFDASSGAFKGETTVGDTPVNLIYAAGYVWVANRADDSLSKLEVTSGKLVETLKIGSIPVAMAYDGVNIWSANQGNNTVAGLAASAKGPLFELPTAVEPVAMLFDGVNLWVVAQSGNLLQKIPITIRRVGEEPVAMARHGDNLWVANKTDETLSRVPTSGSFQVETFALNNKPVDLVSANDHIWVAHGEKNAVSKIRAVDGVRLGAFSTGAAAADALTFDGTQIWVLTKNSNIVTRLRAEDGKRLGQTQIVQKPVDILFDGSHVWLAAAGSQALVKMGSEGEMLTEYPLGIIPDSFIYDGAYFWVAFRSFQIPLTVRLLRVHAADGTISGPYDTMASFGLPLLAYDGQYLWLAAVTTSATAVRIEPGAPNTTNQRVFKICDRPSALVRAGFEDIRVACPLGNLIQKLPGNLSPRFDPAGYKTFLPLILK